MSSLAGQIGDAVVAAIRGLGLAGLASTSVLRRKALQLPEGATPPQVIVMVGEEGQTEPLAATQKLKKWQVAVVIVTAGGQKLSDDDTVRTWREAIDGAVYDKQRVTFAGIAGFNEVNATGRSVFDASALGKDLNYSTLNYEIQTLITLVT